MTSWMIDKNDPARLEVVERARQLGITGDPDKASHALGPVTLADGRTVNAFVVHAVDAVATDGEEIAMINRVYDPGKGLPALPGGLLDPKEDGTVESAVEAAMRESKEEVRLDLTGAKATRVGTRNMDRPFDVRVARGNGLFEKYGISDGDIFMVSTQAVRFDVPDLKRRNLVAGDDAQPGTARRVKISTLAKESMGIPDHFDMIAQACPENFAPLSKTLKIITTDFGADCDDQKAVSDIIAERKPGEALAFIVSGPHPSLAAHAISEKYHARTGHYPPIMLGRQFEEDKKPEDQIYSLADGGSMTGKKASDPGSFPQELFQQAIATGIKAGFFDKVEQIVLAPLHTEFEYFNTQTPELLSDAGFQAAWAKVEKTATLQFQRMDDGTCKGNNYQKSAPDVADGFLAQLMADNVETVYFDGAVAKAPEFLMRVTQESQPGLQKAAESYMATMQAPWLYMTEPLGVTPSADNMHAGMFTPGAQFPFGVHVSAGTPAGFGAERALKEICGITRNEGAAYDAALAPIAAELDRFDAAVLAKLQQNHPEITSVADMRAEMHRGMRVALQSFAEKKGIAAQGETIGSFTDLFKAAKEKNVKLNPYAFMGEYAQELYAQSPLTQEISAIAATEANIPVNGKTHIEALASALSSHGARAIIYDAVAVAAGDVVRGNDALKAHFNDKAGSNVINITADKVAKLKENAELYKAFTDGIREKLVADGAVLAVEGRKANAPTSKTRPSLG